MRSRFRSTRRRTLRRVTRTVAVRPARADDLLDGNDRNSQVPGEPQMRLRHVPATPVGSRAPDRLRRATQAPATGRTRAPALGLSRFNHMALPLAVYASPRRLPAKDARLASGCWSGSTGRASNPQGPDERFRECVLTSQSSSPELCLAQSRFTDPRMNRPPPIFPSNSRPGPASRGLTLTRKDRPLSAPTANDSPISRRSAVSGPASSWTDRRGRNIPESPA